MPLYSIVVTNIHTDEVTEKHFHLSEFSFFQRKPIREYIMMISKEVTSRLQSYDFQVFEQKFNELSILVFVKVYNEYAYISCGKDYPVNIANKFLSECKDCRDFEKLLKEFQDPKSHDILDKIQRDLKETREISVKTLNSLLERNEKLEDLVKRSSELSVSSKIFYKAAHKRNKCC
ncbi:synaptobrevin YKT6-like protein [Vairimorpha necatrix]|uniref:Synaptobrevin YKT6-like protein n=1 Tax=Vairimorpha necatrix TaxID=6039 RepID=A0AAX4JG36_9MICR